MDNLILILFTLIYLADPATFPASHSVLGSLFLSENSLFIMLWKKNMETDYKCFSPKLHSATVSFTVGDGGKNWKIV